MPAPARYFVESPGNTILADHYNSELNNILTGFIPENFAAVSTNTALWQAVTDPGESGSESLPTDTTGEIRRLKNIFKEISGKTYPYQSPSLSLSQIFPVGTIIPFYDYNGAVSFDTSVWKYCDGSTIVDANSSLNGLTLPNLTGRYLVGYGAIGDGLLASATWNSSATGANSINVAHTHSVPSHTHSTSTHTHDSGSLQFSVARSFVVFPTSGIQFFDSGGVGQSVITFSILSKSNSGGSRVTALMNTINLDAYTSTGSGSSASKDAGVTGAYGAADSTSGLSATQDIRPSSIRIRYLMRYK